MAAAPSRLLFLSAIALIALSLSAAAQARHHHHRHSRDLDYQDRVQPASDSRPAEARSAQAEPQAGSLAGAVAQMIRACGAQATELKVMPFDAVIDTVQPNDEQRAALDQIRAAAAGAANQLNTTCPKDVPARLTDRLDTMRASLDAINAALSPLRPVFVAAYAALDDEQKARLAVLAISRRPELAQQDGPPSGRRAVEENSAAGNQAQLVSLDCQQWPTLLKKWPVQQIQSNLSLSDDQQAALYSLMATIYRGAGGLTASCHDDHALTPVARLDGELRRVEALRRYVDAIGTALSGFSNSLNDEQNSKLNVTLGLSPQPEPALVNTSLHRKKRQQ